MSYVGYINSQRQLGVIITIAYKRYACMRWLARMRAAWHECGCVAAAQHAPPATGRSIQQPRNAPDAVNGLRHHIQQQQQQLRTSAAPISRPCQCQTRHFTERWNTKHQQFNI